MGSAARGWLGWAAAALGAGLLAFGAGISGLLGSPVADADFELSVVAPVEGAALLDCPAGEPVGVIARNQRLYVVGRSPDGAWLAVRDVYQGYRTVWVAATAIDVDEYPLRIAQLPKQDCAVLEVGP